MDHIIFIIFVINIFFVLNYINHYLGLYFLSMAIETMVRLHPALLSFIILVLVWIVLEKILIYLERRT